jgi:uncharacterized delta-60 repeat protein
VFKIKPDGSDWHTVASLESPAHGGVIEDGAGFVWGMLIGKGGTDYGVPFKLEMASGEVTLGSKQGVAAGAKPLGGLVKAPDSGGIYALGLASAGGANDFGSIYSVRLISAFALSKRIDFTGTAGEFRGAAPMGDLVPDGSGWHWGTTSAGGTGNFGTVFKYHFPTNGFVTVVDFTSDTGPNPGAAPHSTLVSDGAGSFWGTTTAGGVHGHGTIFKIDIATSALTTVIHFANGTGDKGAAPTGALVPDGNGYLWGTTSRGGAAGMGTVFKVHMTTGTLTSVAEFTDSNEVSGQAQRGREPLAGLVDDGTGHLWGVTSRGGLEDAGTLYKIDIVTGALTTIRDLADRRASRGRKPMAGLNSDGGKWLWGTTWEGGESNRGTVYKVHMYTDELMTVASFSGDGPTNRGANPASMLMHDGGGAFWGTTVAGGAHNVGTVFKLDTDSGLMTTIAEFTDNGAENRGAAPYAGVTDDGQGCVWGATSAGAAGGNGTLFKIHVETGAMTTVVEFTGNAGANKGRQPMGRLLLMGDELWGTTAAGGSGGHGTVFRVHRTTGVFTTVVEFSGSAGYCRGAAPFGALTLAEDGMLWGTTSAGGSSDGGTIFKIDGATGSLITVADLSAVGSFSNVGFRPYMGLIGNGSGSLWCATHTGGLYVSGSTDFGAVLRVNIATGEVTSTFKFYDVLGLHPPYDSLFRHTDGNLYGAASTHGPNGAGTVYRLRDGATPVTGNSSSVTGWQASITGTVTPNVVGTVTSTFEYGTAPDALNSSTPPKNRNEFSEYWATLPVSVGETLTNLQPNTTYYYRLKVSHTSSLRPQYGDILTFTTGPPSSNADLGDLELLDASNGLAFTPLVPAFHREHSTYAITVPYTVVAVKVRCSIADAASTMTVNGHPLVNNVSSHAINLAYGSPNVIPIVCAAQDGITTKTYTVSVTRDAPKNGDIDLDFAAAVPLPNTPFRNVLAGQDGTYLVIGEDGIFGYAPDGSLLTSFSPVGLGEEFAFHHAALQSDGKVVACGEIRSENAPVAFGVARFNVDGTLDHRFGTDGTVMTNLVDGRPAKAAKRVVVQPDGRIVVAGDVSYGDDFRYGLARYLADGSLDLSFGVGGTVATPMKFFGQVNGLIQQRDGKLIAAGTTGSSRNEGFALVRYLPNGALDSSFGTSGKVVTPISANHNYCTCLALQDDGKILAGGHYSIASSYSVTDFAVLRYLPNGSLDSTFGTGGKATVSMGDYDQGRALCLQNDGKILLSGSTAQVSSFTPTLVVLRFLANGSLDSSFGDGGKVKTNLLNSGDLGTVALPNGQIVVAGGGVTSPRMLVRFHSTLLPAAVPAAVTNLTTTSATLNGSVNANEIAGGGLTTVSFELSTDGINYETVAATPDHASGSQPVAISAPLSGLIQDVVYRYRIRATNHLGTTVSGDALFSAISTNPNLAGITLSVGASLSPAFNAAVTSYTAKVRFFVPAVTVTPTPAQADATIKVNGTPVASGTGVPVNLAVGPNTVDIQITAQDGLTTASYSLVLTRADPPGTLDPTFNTTGHLTAVVGDGGRNEGRAVAVQPDGMILAAGNTGNAEGDANDFVLARFKEDGTLDPNFAAGGIAVTPIGDGRRAGVRCMALQSDGKILVAGGAFVNGSGTDAALVRYLANGTLDPHFGDGGRVLTDSGPMADDFIQGMALQSDGKIIVTGYANTPGGKRLFLARYNANGSLDAAFGTSGKVVTDLQGNGEAQGRDVVVMSNGRIIVAGYRSQAGAADFALAGYLSTGSLDPAFGTGGMVFTDFGDDGDETAWSIAAQPDGRLVVAGTRNDSSGGSAVALARYLADGSLDSVFGTNGRITSNFSDTSLDFGRAVWVQKDGRILVAGSTRTAEQAPDFLLMRFLDNGSPDPNFGSAGRMATDGLSNHPVSHEAALDLALQANGGIVVIGHAGDGESTEFALARYGNALAPSVDLVAPANLTAKSVALAADIAANPNQPGDTATVSLAVGTDAQYYVSHTPTVTTVSTTARSSRNMANLVPDTTYHYYFRASSIVGITIARGTFHTPSNNAELAGISVSTGTLSQAFDSNVTSYAVEMPPLVQSITLTPALAHPRATLTIKVNGAAITSKTDTGAMPLPLNGEAMVAFEVRAQDGTTKLYQVSVTRPIPSEGKLDLSFNGSGMVQTIFETGNSQAESAVVLEDGRILAGGTVTAGANRDFALVRYLPNGALDTSFGYGGKVITPISAGNDYCYSIALQPDGKILAAGRALDGVEADFALVRYHQNGALDPTFGTGGKVVTPVGASEDSAQSIAVQKDGKIVVAGYSNSSATLGDFAVVRYEADGTLDQLFGTGGKVITDVGNRTDVGRSVEVLHDGAIVVAGRFSTPFSSGFGLVRYLQNGGLDMTFGLSGKIMSLIGNGRSHGEALAVQSDGKFVMAGAYTATGEDFAFARYLPDGHPDTQFSGNGAAIITTSARDHLYDVAIQNDGRIAAVGFTELDGGKRVMAVARRLANGGADSDFGNEGLATVDFGVSYQVAKGVALTRDGKIVVVGGAGPTSTQTHFAIAQLHQDRPAPPDIAVFGPDQTELPNGSAASIEFGEVAVGGETHLPITVYNAGVSYLKGLSVAFEGEDAAMFSVVETSMPWLSIEGSKVLHLRFKPSSKGVRSAVLRITSNDPDENPFSISLTGGGAPANLPVAATKPATAVTFSGATLNGTVNAKGMERQVFFDYGATTAYGSVAAAAGSPVRAGTVVNVSAPINGLSPHTKYYFRLRVVGAEGTANGAATTFVTANRQPTAADDSFAVVAGSQVTLPVLSNDDDPDGDALLLKSFTPLHPKSAGTLKQSGNNLIFTAADSFSAGTSAYFGYAVSDGFGPSATATVTLTAGGLVGITPPDKSISHYRHFYTLSVAAGGHWSVGKLPSWLNVSPASGTGSGDTYVTVQSNPGAQPRTATIRVGNAVHTLVQAGIPAPQLTLPAQIPLANVGAYYELAIPTSGLPSVRYTTTQLPPGLTMRVEDNITPTRSYLAGVPTKAGTYKFTVKATNAAGVSNTLAFDLMVNPLPESAAGSFQGFVARNPSLNNNLGSRIEFTVTANASYSGKLITASSSNPFKGQLIGDNNDIAHPVLGIMVPRKGLPPLTIQLALDTPNNTFSGEAFSSAGGVSAAATGWRLIWNLAHKATDYSLLYNFSLATQSAAADLPQGFGFGAFTPRETTGGFNLAGRVPDGSSLTSGGVLGPNGEVLIYQPLYANRGSVAGLFAVTKGSAREENTVATTTPNALTWMKRPVPPNSKETTYRNGFDPLPLTAEGGAYRSPAKGQVVMGLENAFSNVRFDFLLGSLQRQNAEFGLTFSLLNTSSSGLTQQALMPDANPNFVTLQSIAPTTGLYKGQFTVPADLWLAQLRVNFHGLIIPLPSGPVGRGYFLLPEAPDDFGENISNTPTHSGRVILSPLKLEP